MHGKSTERRIARCPKRHSRRARYAPRVEFLESRRLLTTINEFTVPTTGGPPNGITGGPDGNVWFTDDNGNIGRVTPDGHITEFPIQPNPKYASHPDGITTGADQNLWFAESGPFSGTTHNHIGRMSPEGVLLNDYEIATFPSTPRGVATGSDGNVWFTEYDSNSIGRIKPDGTIDEFPIPGSENEPLSIAEGPDGNLWFTTNNSESVWKITTNGAITQYPWNDYTYDIVAAGLDGSVWFTNGGSRLARIAPTTGIVTEVPLPARVFPTRLTNGPDFNLWFTDRGNNQLDRLTPAGDLTRFAFPTPQSNTSPLTTGPDGNIWFGEGSFTGSKIAQLVLDAPGTAPDLALSGSAPASVSLGENVTYSFTVTNGGTSGASGVTLADTLPTGVTFVSAAGGIKPDNGVVTFHLGNLAKGASEVVTIVVTPTAVGALNNQASLSGNDDDATPADNSLTQKTTVTPPAGPADLVLSGNAPGMVALGDNLTYTLSVKNSGTVAATGVTLADTLPAGVTFVSATGGATPVAGVLTFHVGNLAVGASDTVNIVVTPTALGTLTSKADVSGNENDPNLGNNSITQNTVVPSFVVNTTDDELTPDDGKTSLREAIAVANALPGHTITFDPVIFPAGGAATIKLKPDPGYRGLELKGNVTIVGPGASALSVQGAGAGSDFSVFTVDAGVNATISALTVTLGRVLTNGGGINNQGTLTLTDCAIAGNSSANQGGGIYSTTTLTLTNCNITHNEAGGSGGGLYANSGTTYVTGGSFARNKAGFQGGGIEADSGTMTITDTSVTDNMAATSGGGIRNADPGVMSLFRVTIARNTATGANSASGGIINRGTLGMTDCTVVDNKASYNGGVANNKPGSVTMVRCTVTRNVATSGENGGIGNYDDNLTMILTDCTVANNTAATSGGGIGNKGNLTLTSCTVSGNTVTGAAGVGGGVYLLSGTLTLLSTIVAGNLHGTGPNSVPSDIIKSGAPVIDKVSAYNLIGVGGTGNTLLTDATHNNRLGIDPLLGPLQDNGGPTQTMALRDGSPAFDAGTQAPLLDTDQRGLPRVFHGKADIGAYESQTVLAAPSLVVNTTNDELIVGNDKTSLREAVALANALRGGTITFDPAVFPAGGTAAIQLLNDPAHRSLELKSTMTIVGPGAKGLSVLGGVAAPKFSVFVVDSGVTAAISGLTVKAGYAEFGGGIYSLGTLRLDECTITSNSGTIQGGAIYCFGKLIVNACAITNNKSGIGGGVLGMGTTTLTNTTVAKNTAISGGGIASDSSLTLINCTIAGNSDSAKGRGGGIHVQTTLTLRNTIVAGNFKVDKDNQPDDIGLVGGTVDASSSYNLIGTGGSGGLKNGVNHNLVGFAPFLGALQDNGGPTETMALLLGSPAVDAGSNALVPKGLITDQRGRSRVFRGTVDIGAFERQFVPIASFVVNTTADDLDPADGTTSLREAIFFANAAPGHTITFDPAVFPADGDATIQLIDNPAHGTLKLSSNVTISGPGAKALTVKGGGSTSDFNLLKVGTGVTAKVSGLTFRDGHTSGNGGAINNQGTVTLTACAITANSAGDSGGGIYNLGTLAVTGSALADNSAKTFGGAIFTSNGNLSVIDCTLASNDAGTSGGGIAAQGSVTVTSSTFSLNTATYGGAIDNFIGAYKVTIADSILAGNSAPSGPDFQNSVISLGNNLIGETDNSFGWIASDLTGTAVRPLDPGLAPLGDNGGPTKTMALLLGSPAVDAGSNALVPAGITTDQRGRKRVFHGAVDIGAFERQIVPAPNFVVSTTNDNLDPADGATSLREAIFFANAAPGHTITLDPAVFPAGGNTTIHLIDNPAHRTLELKSDVKIVGPGANAVTIAGGGPGSNFSVFAVDAGVTAAISGVTITGGTGTFGGGVSNSGQTSLTNCAIEGNVAAGGGGIYSTAGSVTLTNCTIAGNTATNGAGGIGGTDLALTNCTVAGNSSRAGGGIISVGTVTLNGCTVAGNRSTTSAGGGLQVADGTVLLRNTIVAGNFQGAAAASTPGDILMKGGSVDLASAYNLIGTGGSGGLTTGINHNLVGVDPLLGPLQDNGGPTKTMALLDGSPAFDAGSNTLVPAGITTDQRGLPRLFDRTVDIGAYESQAILPATLLVNTTDDELTPGDGKTSLREAIAQANLLGSGTITFDPAVFAAGGAATIQLTDDPAFQTLTLKSYVTIVGPGAKSLKIKGGGVNSDFSVFKVDPGKIVAISGLTITNGNGSKGGGIFNAGSLTLSAIAIEGNSASTVGGGVYSSSRLTMIDCTVAGNSAQSGAGIDVVTGGPATLINCTVAENTASVNTGGILDSSSSGLTLINCTVAANRSLQFFIGAGIAALPSTLTLKNTIVAGNVNGPAPSTVPSDLAISTINASSAYNLIGSTRGNPLINGVNHNIVGVVALLGPLQDNGGPTKTMVLKLGSPARDKGSNALVPTGIATDQRGFLRIGKLVVDIGAYES